jgi:hypothetical protein
LTERTRRPDVDPDRCRPIWRLSGEEAIFKDS